MIDDITIYNLSLFLAGNDLNELYASAYDYKKHFFSFTLTLTLNSCMTALAKILIYKFFFGYEKFSVWFI